MFPRSLTKLNDSQRSENLSEGNETVVEIDIGPLHYTLVSSPSKSQYHLSPREQELGAYSGESAMIWPPVYGVLLGIMSYSAPFALIVALFARKRDSRKLDK